MSGRAYIYTMHDLRKAHPNGRTVLDGISLQFYPDAKIGIIGRNGAGKSTLLRIMAGVDTEFGGEARLAEGATVGYLPQEPHLAPGKTVRACVEEGVAATKALLDQFEAVSNRFAEVSSDEEMQALIDEQARLQERIDALGAWDLDRQLEIAMDALRLPPGDARVDDLSGGERRRVALCRLLLEKPDLLLLDEPTNHLDAETVAWLENHLRTYPGAVLIVTHDRYFLDNIVGWILELEGGKGIPWKGNYSSWLEQKQERLAAAERQESKRRKQLARELEWIRMTPSARRARNKARVAAYEKLLEQAQDRTRDTTEIHIPFTRRLGNVVVEAQGISKSYGDKILFEDLSFHLPRGGIVGVIGPNGAGKTTLFRMIVGETAPDTGTLRIGETVDLAYVDQTRDALDPDKTVWEEISDGQETLRLGDREINSRAYVGKFNFLGPDQQKKVGVLSGGERNRVHLAKLLRRGGNLLLLDEPTNDLDVETLRHLEEALLAFPGCAVVVSHDRWFLDRIATHILAFEGESRVTWFEGNYADYEADRRKRLGDDALVPKRVKYRRLTR